MALGPGPGKGSSDLGRGRLASKLGNRCGVNLRTAKMCGVCRENGVSPKSSVEQLVLQMFVLGAQVRKWPILVTDTTQA